MKVLRGLYLYVCYAFGVPLVVFVGLPAFIMSSIYSKIKFGNSGMKNAINGMKEGIKEGHRINMLFVKYGRDFYDHYEGL